MKEVFAATTFKEDDFLNLLGIFDNIIGKVSLEPVDAYEIPAFEPLPDVPSYGSPIADARFASTREQAPIGKAVPTIPKEERRRYTAAEEVVEDDRPPPRAPFEQRWVAKQGKASASDFWGNTTFNLDQEFSDRYRASTGRALTGSRLQKYEKVYEAGLLDPPFFERLQREEKVGVGLKHEEHPRFAHLGKIAIDPHALYYQNTLKVLSHNKHHYLGYKNTKVSEDMVSILMDLLKGKFPTGNELKKLDLHEKELYDNVIHLAHLHKKAEHNLPQTRQSMKHRFELLNGEIGAGNTNKALKAELKQLVHKMAHGGMISHTNAWKYLKSL
jgi:hypothetical protein